MRSTLSLAALIFSAPVLFGGCATSFAPEEASTSLTAGPQSDPETEEKGLRIQQLFIRGITRSLVDDHRQAIFLFEQAVQLDENQPAILHALAQSHATLAELETALYYSRRAHRLEPSNRAYLLHHAELLERNENPEDALNAYEQWLTVYPGDTEVRFLAAELLVKMGREQEALAQYRDIIRYDGDDLDVRFRILQLYNGLGNTDGMFLTVQAMLEIDPTNNALLLILADLHVERGQTDAAIGVLEQALSNDADDVEALIALSELYCETGRDDEAERLSADASQDPVAAGAIRLSVATELYSRAGTDDEAAEKASSILSDILEDGEESSEALFMLGNLRFREARYDEAADLLERALALDPRHPDEWARAASSLRQSGDVTRALNVAHEGLMLFPGQFPLLSIAAEVSLETGDYSGSIEFSTEAIEVLDNNPSTDLLRARAEERLGDAHAALGDQERARSYWEAALISDPELESARNKLESHP
ncbi:MAG: tetratricopeptide repeat protein [Rhodothermia bacterium]